MKKLSQILAAVLLVVGLLGSSVALQAYASTHTLQFVETPAIALYASESSTATSMVVTPVPVDLDGNVLTMASFGSSPTLTVDPGIQGAEEIESFSSITNNGNNTATIGGLTRDLQSQYPYGTNGTGISHGAGATVVFSNNPQLYNRLASWENDGYITGSWQFVTQPSYQTSQTFSNPLALVDQAYVLGVAIQGAGTSTESAMGVVRLATFGQVGTGLASSTSGQPLVIENKFASSTYNASTAFQGEIPALRSTKDIDPNFIATSTGNVYNFATLNIASSTIGTSTQATTTITGVLIYKGSTLGTPKFGGTGVDGALSASSGITTIALGTANYYEKDYTSISLTGTAGLSFSSNATSSSGVTIVLRSQGACTFTSSVTVINLKYLGGGMGTGLNGFSGDNGSQGGGGGGGGGGSTAGAGTNGTFNAGNNVFYGAPGLGGVQLPALASSTPLALPGGNGSPGGNGTGSNGGAAGLGGGGLYIECGGAYTFTSGTIDATGANGFTGASNTGTGTGGGGGGAGAGGNVLVRAASISSDTGTYTMPGGSGGSEGSNTGGGQSGQFGGNAAAGSHLEIVNSTNY